MQQFLKQIALLLILCCYYSQISANSKKILLATGDWPPYVYQSEPVHGKFVQVVSAVFKEMGVEVEYVFAPWKRVEVLVESGEAFAAIPYAYTEERYKTFDYSVPIMDSSYVFFYNKKNFPQGINYARLEDLQRYRISGVTGYWYKSLFSKAKLNMEYVTSDEQGIIKLYFNRVDLAASDSLVGWDLIKKLYPREAAQFGVVSKPFSAQYLHLMVSRKYPNAKALTEKFNATFKALQDEGRLPQ